ncbi:MAG: glycosyltransferase family 4 protein, partial [Candidatus Riflebacteria bacterium]|nr:glycosyltransferase family 4 protein [Candidatus Riflebacteria bacterium]
MAFRIARAINQESSRFDVVHYHGHCPLVPLFVRERNKLVLTFHDFSGLCPGRLNFRDTDRCVDLDRRRCGGCLYGTGAIRNRVTAFNVRLLRHFVAQALSGLRVMFVSTALREVYRTNLPGSDQGRWRTVHNFSGMARMWPGSTRLDLVARHGLAAARAIGLVLADFSAAKGVLSLLELLHPLLASWNLGLVVAGDGPQMGRIRQRFTGDRVALPGWLTEQDAISHLRSADFAVLPTLCDEACSTVMLQALWARLPVFALDRGGNRELAAHGPELCHLE